MPKQVGNQNQQRFVAIVYFWHIRQTLWHLLLCSLDIKYFRAGCFPAPRMQRPGIAAPSPPLAKPLLTRSPIYKISYDLSSDYLQFIVRSTYDSDLQRA